MNNTDQMIPCPSCGAMLDSAGHCAYCGGQARVFWADPNLGTPELAVAIVNGLDYYLVLGVSPRAVPVEIAGEYHRARSRFPDDPRRLVPQVARSLGLIECATRGRTGRLSIITAVASTYKSSNHSCKTETSSIILTDIPSSGSSFN